MITGPPAVHAATAPVAIAYKHVQENPVPPRRDRPGAARDARGHHPQVPGQEPRQPLPDGRGPARRPAPLPRRQPHPGRAGAGAADRPRRHRRDGAHRLRRPDRRSWPARSATSADGYGDSTTTTTTTTRRRSPSGPSGSWPRWCCCCSCWPGCCSCWPATSAATTTTEAELVTVPNVVGQPVAEATRASRPRASRSTRPRRRDRPARTRSSTRTRPPASEADEGSTVTLTVSAGPETVPVPDVRDRRQTRPTSAGIDRGLRRQRVAVENDEVEEGLVISQDPAAKPGGPPGGLSPSSVVGIGHAPVPDVADRQRGDGAGQLSAGAGFTNDHRPSRRRRTTCRRARWSASTRAAGAEVAPDHGDHAVRVVRRQDVNVPGVEGLTEDNARALIEGAGLVSRCHEEPSPTPARTAVCSARAPRRTAGRPRQRRSRSSSAGSEPETAGDGGGGG